MKKVLYILAVIIIIVIIILWYKAYNNKDRKPQHCYHSNPDGSVIEVPCVPGGTGTGIYPTSTTTLPTGPKTLNDFVGKRIVAKYDGTKLYNNDLTLATTYNTGDYIGWLGGEAKGYLCCKNQSNFYKVYDNSNTTGLCGCEPIMSDEALKSIFGI